MKHNENTTMTEKPTPVEMLRKAYHYMASNTRYNAESVAKMHGMNLQETENLVSEWLQDNTLLQEIGFCIDRNS